MKPNPVTTGTHRNGEKFAKVYIRLKGQTVTVEGSGKTAVDARDDLRINLSELVALAEDVWTSIELEEAFQE